MYQVVRQMPTMASSKQPTIAVITAQYCEKLAVDSMLENKETYVRYTTVGKRSVLFSYSPCLKVRQELHLRLIIKEKYMLKLISASRNGG